MAKVKKKNRITEKETKNERKATEGKNVIREKEETKETVSK